MSKVENRVKQGLILSVLPEQYEWLKLEAEKVGSLEKLVEKAIDFQIKLQNNSTDIDDRTKIVFDSLEKVDITELLGNDYKAWYLRGILLNSLERYEEAIASFDVALKIQPNLQKAWYNKGMAYYAIDFYERAIEDFRKAVELDPSDYLSWYSLGKSLSELEVYDEAFDDIKLVQVAILLVRYKFDMKGYPVQKLIEKWVKRYPPHWIRVAIIEALYQGRYKAISVEQILELWLRRRIITCHFTPEFERLICHNLPSTILTDEFGLEVSDKTKSKSRQKVEKSEKETIDNQTEMKQVILNQV